MLSQLLKRSIFFLLITVNCFLGVKAENGCEGTNIPVTQLPRPITSTYSFEIGRHDAKSTYLSPFYYHGLDLAIAGQWSKVMPFSPQHARMTFDTRISLWPSLLNPAGNASMIGFDIDFFWGMQAYWNLPHSFSIAIGGGPEFNGGILTLLRNSNNPVSVNLYAGLSAFATISWRGRIGRLPVSASWQLRSPFIGAFFMPGYGETYYEIWLGNHKGLAHAGWPGNHQAVNSRLAVQLDFGRTALEVGYRIITDKVSANNLTTRQLTHALSIGVIPHGLGRKNKLNQTPHEIR